MAPRSRATRSRAAPKATSSTKPAQRQSSLTFNNNRITKPTNGSLSAQEKKAKAAADAKAVKLLQEDDSQATVKVETEPETETQATPKTRSRTEVKAEAKAEAEDEIIDDEQAPESHTTKPIPIRSQQQANDPEAAARKVSEAQIKRYWKAKEAERMTPRVHQQGLSLHEKVLREFDVSYQYGPCIGITRLKRWHRAKNLDLEPPIEVLAVLIKSAGNGDDASADGNGRAYIDILASARLGIVAQ